MCILNYGGVGDREIKYVHMNESIVLEALNFFARAIQGFNDSFLCQPTNEDVFNEMLNNEKKKFSISIREFGLHALGVEELPSAIATQNSTYHVGGFRN